MSIVILSPHLDDALFSLSNLILTSKHKIIIVTLFTKEVENNFVGDYALYADTITRKEEDVKVINKIKSINPEIKIESIYLNLPDNLFRNDNTTIVTDIINKFISIKENHAIDYIFCPLGIGEHVDHLLTYDCCIEVFDKDKTFFYFDYPYCNLKLNIVKRFNTLQLKHDFYFTLYDIIYYFNHPMYNSCPFIICLLKIIWIYLFCFVKYDKISNLICSNKIDISNKYSIISNYTSQIKPIFGNFEQLKNTLKEFNEEFYIKIY